MDKQSRTISVKVNGTEAKYEEKKKDEFEWMVVEGERPRNVVPFQKAKSMSVEKYRKKWSNTLIAIVATAIIIGTAFGMGMLHLLTGQGTTGGSEVTASQPTGNGESKVGGTAGQTSEPKEEKQKSTGRSVIGSDEIIFCSRGGFILLKKRDEQLLKNGKAMGALEL